MTLRLSTAQFQALLDTALAEDGTIHGHGGARNKLMSYALVHTASRAPGARMWWQPTPDGWRALHDHLEWMRERDTSRTAYENNALTNADALHVQIAQARHRAHLRAHGQPTFRPVASHDPYTPLEPHVVVDLTARTMEWRYTPRPSSSRFEPTGLQVRYDMPPLTPRAANTALELMGPYAGVLCHEWTSRQDADGDPYAEHGREGLHADEMVRTRVCADYLWGHRTLIQELDADKVAADHPLPRAATLDQARAHAGRLVWDLEEESPSGKVSVPGLPQALLMASWDGAAERA